MTQRIACLRSCPRHCATLFHQVAGFVLVSTDHENRPEQSTEFSVLLALVFYVFPNYFHWGLGNFLKILGSDFPSDVCRRDMGPLHIQRVQVDFLFPLKVLRVQIPRKVLNLPVVLRRRDTYSVTVQNTVEIPQMQFLDKLMIKRLVPGRDGADNCGGSAVAWGPCRDSAGAVLGRI